MYGLSNVLVNGMGPFNCIDTLRQKCNKYVPVIGAMLECMMCTSLNIGWVFSLINIFCFPLVQLTPFNLWIGDVEYWYLILILDAFFTTGVVWVISSFQEMCERLSNYFSNTDDYNE
jgi:hypothetical protein